MKTNNFSFSNFSLSVSDEYKYEGLSYRNYDFRSEDGERFAYFSVCIDKENIVYDYIPEAYDFSDYEVREAFEEVFRTKTNDEIKKLFN